MGLHRRKIPSVRTTLHLYVFVLPDRESVGNTDSSALGYHFEPRHVTLSGWWICAMSNELSCECFCNAATPCSTEGVLPRWEINVNSQWPCGILSASKRLTYFRNRGAAASSNPAMTNCSSPSTERWSERARRSNSSSERTMPFPFRALLRIE